MKNAVLIEALEKLMAREGLRDKMDLAAYLGEPYSTVYRWFEGGAPSLDKFERLARRLGGDLRRAFPDHLMDEILPATGPLGSPSRPGFPPAESSEAVLFSPEIVSAEPAGNSSAKLLGLQSRGAILSTNGSARMTTASKKKTDLPGSVGELFEDHPLAAFCSGPAYFLRMEGDRMAPRFPDGALVVIRRAARPKEVPDGTLAIFRETTLERREFRRLRRVPEAALVLGFPVCERAGDTKVWKEAEVEIRYLALGCIARTLSEMP
jgi:hypothetical protein